MKKFLFVLLATMLSTSIFAQEKLTLEKAIAIALHSNSNIIKSNNNLYSSKADVKSAKGDFLPTFGVSSGWSWAKTKDVGGTQLDFLGNEVNIPESEYDTRDYNLRAGGNVVLFDGLANVAKLSSAKKDYEADKLSLERLKEDVIYQTTAYYYDILAKQAVIKVQEENLKFNKEFLETVKERNRLGSVPVADLYNQQVQYGNAELALIKAQNDAEYSVHTFLTYLSLDVLKDYTFVMPEDSNNSADDLISEFSDLSAKVKEAMANRADYSSKKLNVESNEKRITQAQGSLFPTLTGDYGYSSRSTKINNLFDRKTFSAGLTLSWSLFSNWNTERAVDYAKIAYKNSQEDLSVLERRIKVEIKQGYLDLVYAKKGLDVSIKNVQAASETRRINQERYNLGSGTILEVLQASRDFQDAQRVKIDAEFLYYRNRDRLLNFLGRLDVNEFENLEGEN